MTLNLYKTRCQCKEKEEECWSITEQKKPKKESRALKLKFSYLNPLYSTIFQISYKKNLSSKAKCILNGFHRKYIYYAIDDILYLLKSTPNEQSNLLKIIYSPIISLQNNFSVNFFDIWIDEIYIDEKIKKNRFLKTKSKTLKNDHLITIKLFYKIKKRNEINFFDPFDFLINY